MIDISVLREAFLNAKTLKRIAEKHRFTDLCGGIVDISNYTMVTSSINMLKHKPEQDILIPFYIL
jgi:hypothetical protein